MKKLTVWKTLKISCVTFIVMYIGLYMTKKNKNINSVERMFVGGLSEMIKVVICFSIGYWREGYEKTEYMPGYIVSGFLSSFQSFAWIYGAQTFTTVITHIFGQSRIFFIYIMTTIFLGKRYTMLQNISQVILFLGIFIPLISEVMFNSKSRSNLIKNSLFDYIIIICLPILSAASGIFFEKCIVKKIQSKWKNAVNYSISSAIISFFIAGIMYLITGHTLQSENLKSIVYMSSIKSMDSLLFGYIILYYSTLSRVFITLAVSVVVSIVSTFHSNESLSMAKLISMGVTSGSIAFFHLPYYLKRRKEVIHV